MFDKPLFSKRQLYIIICVTAIAIVLLSASGQRDEVPEINVEQRDRTTIYWLEQDSDLHYLSLSFALPEDSRGDSIAVRLVQQTLLNALRKNVQHQDATIKLNSYSDRLQIALTASTEQSISDILPLLIEQLLSPIDRTEWSQLQKHQQAQQYLDNQSADPSWSQMHAWLQPEQSKYGSDFSRWTRFREQLFSRSQLSVALMSGDAEALLPPLRGSLEKIPEGFQWNNAEKVILPPQQQILSTLGEYQLLIGRYTQGRGNSNFAEQMIAIREIQRQAKQLNVYSEWRPLGQHSKLLISASSAAPITLKDLLNRLKNKLQMTTNDELDSHRIEAIDHLFQRFNNPLQLFEQLEAIAFYRLPENYLEGFVSQLDQLSSSRIRDQISALLAAEHYHQISQQPAQ